MHVCVVGELRFDSIAELCFWACVELPFDISVELSWCRRVVLGFVVDVELLHCRCVELRFDISVELSLYMWVLDLCFEKKGYLVSGV